MISRLEMKKYFIHANCHALKSLKNGFKHDFHETTYFKPTFCAHCAGLVSMTNRLLHCTKNSREFSVGAVERFVSCPRFRRFYTLWAMKISVPLGKERCVLTRTRKLTCPVGSENPRIFFAV